MQTLGSSLLFIGNPLLNDVISVFNSEEQTFSMTHIVEKNDYLHLQSNKLMSTYIFISIQLPFYRYNCMCKIIIDTNSLHF